MLVCEGQRLGALTIILAAMTVYGISVLKAHLVVPQTPLPWGNQVPGAIVVEVTGDGGGDGIYFFPGGTTLPQILTGVGIESGAGETAMAKESYSAGSAMAISVNRGVTELTDLPASRRLALGLPIDLNTALEPELSLIPGIGSKMASKVVQLRQTRGKFRRIEELMDVAGIGEKKLNDIKKYFILKDLGGPL